MSINKYIWFILGVTIFVNACSGEESKVSSEEKQKKEMESVENKMPSELKSLYSQSQKNSASLSKDQNPVYPDVLKNRYSGLTLSFQNMIWIIGGKQWTGRNVAEDNYNDIWVSNNGKDWDWVGEVESWKEDTLLTSAVFQDQMWVFANLATEPYVMSSGNGKDWITKANHLPLNPDFRYEALVFKNKLWLLGSNKVANQSEVWSSDDGVIWNKETTTAPFYSKNKDGGGSNGSNAYFVFQDQMWAVHVLPEQTDKVLVWSSSNGKDWSQRKELSYLQVRPPWAFSSSFTEKEKQDTNYVPLSATVFQNKVYLWGASKVAVSSDGINWSTTKTNRFIQYGANILLTENKAFTFLSSFSFSKEREKQQFSLKKYDIPVSVTLEEDKWQLSFKSKVLWSDNLLEWSADPLP